MSQVSTQSYEPKPAFAEQDGFANTPPQPSVEFAAEPQHAEGGIANDGPTQAASDEPESQGFDARDEGAYQPPSSGYEPPAYQPYEPEPELEEEAPKRKLKPMMDDDDDDDIVARAAALKSSKQSEADRQADAAFRAAAEADAARGQDDKSDKDKKGWFGGWFGGKKDQMPGPGPVRAKLGEQNSFYFDKDLNKWVNKKGGSEAATPAASTPPPPRGPPSRVASATVGGPPPMGPPSRNASGGDLSAMGSFWPTDVCRKWIPFQPALSRWNPGIHRQCSSGRFERPRRRWLDASTPTFKLAQPRQQSRRPARWASHRWRQEGHGQGKEEGRPVRGRHGEQVV
jgi:hypothetical protein